MISIVWHRGDVRVHDHLALWAAQQQGKVLPLVIIDEHIFERATVSARRKAFFLENVRALREKYRQLGANLVVRQGKPEQLIPQLVQEWQAEQLHFLQSYSPYGRQRDTQVEEACSIPVYAHPEGISMRAPEAVLNKSGLPYKVYTPYKNAWRAQTPLQLVPTPERLEPIPTSIAIGEIPDITSDIPLPAVGEEVAMQQLATFLTRAHHYHETRNHISSSDGTSHLAPHFTLGVLSPRFAFQEAQKHSNEGTITWQNELIWRDFNHSLLYHFPHIIRQPYKEKWQDFPWRDALEDVARWQAGATGYPLVDAGMRELQQTGFMHNRVRMVVASFLTKHLLIDWRIGEKHFKTLLFDGDTANNVGNWQWSAGCGADAQPYFRVFNPISQVDKFAAHDYIRRYVPELAPLSNKAIGMPSTAERQQCHYPAPMVEHKVARARFLQLAKEVLG